MYSVGTVKTEIQLNRGNWQGMKIKKFRRRDLNPGLSGESRVS